MFSFEQILWLVVALLMALVLLTRSLNRRAERVVPPLGRFVDLPLARLHLVDQGPTDGADGPVVILIHGLGGQLRHFSYALTEYLVPHYRVIAIDRPGSGYSTWRGRFRPSLEMQADVVASLIDHLQLGRVILVGHSLGGAVALCTALRYRDHIAGLALLSPLTHMPERVPPVFLALAIGRDWFRVLLAWTLAVPLGRWQRSRFLKKIFEPDSVPADFGTRAGGELALRPGHFLAATRDLAAIPQSLSAMSLQYGALGGDQPIPVSLLYGRQDRVLSADLQGAHFVSRLPHAKLVQIDAGHMLPIVQPQACASLIRHCAALTGSERHNYNQKADCSGDALTARSIKTDGAI